MKKLSAHFWRLLFTVLLCVASGAQAQYAKLFDFGGNLGVYPYNDLTLSGTNFFGVATEGGSNNLGVIFRVNVDGTGYTLLHTFSGGNEDGSTPFGSPTLIGTTLYGTTQKGGSNDAGVVYSINTDGSGYTNLHTFVGGVGDGSAPQTTLVLSGTIFYGTATSGGVSNKGVVFNINTDGSGYTNLYEFTGTPDNAWNPDCKLTLSGTNLFGTTTRGGTSDKGVIFALHTDGTGYTNLHSFAGGANDGSLPNFGVMALSGSKLYGQTTAGGPSTVGVIFSINTDGSGYTNLHSFAGIADGAQPISGVTLAGQNLYGLTTAGGSNFVGVLFQMRTDGSGFTNLYQFGNGANDGQYPYGDPTISGTNLYGLTARGGTNNQGTIFTTTISLPTADITVLANPTNGGSVSGGGTFAVADSIQLTATASNGWVFTGWNDGATNNPYSITVPETNITYTANFAAAANVTVVGSTNVGGRVTGSGTFIIGSNAVLTATASNGWSFIGWNDGATNNPYTITVASNVTYTAQFAPFATITLQVNPANGGAATGGGTFAVGTNVQLVATASNGWAFVNWDDGDTNTNRSYLVASNSTLTANFRQTISYVLLQNGAGGVTGYWTLNTNIQVTTWSQMGSPLGGAWIIRAMRQNRALLQQGDGGLTGLWDLDANGTPTNWWQVSGALAGWIMRDYDHGRILLQNGDGGVCGIWTLNTNNQVTAWTELWPAAPGLVVRSLRGNRVLLQFVSGPSIGVIGLWTLNESNAVTTWTPILAPLPTGWILRSLTETHILLQNGDGGEAGIWDIDNNGQPVTWHAITGPIPGWSLHSLDEQ